MKKIILILILILLMSCEQPPNEQPPNTHWEHHQNLLQHYRDYWICIELSNRTCVCAAIHTPAHSTRFYCDEARELGMEIYKREHLK